MLIRVTQLALKSNGIASEPILAMTSICVSRINIFTEN